METYGVVAEYDPHEDAYDVLANFQGPFSSIAVIARALKVPANRLRLRHAARFRRQLRRQAGGRPLRRPDGARRRASPAGRSNGSRTGWSTSPASVSATNRVTTLKAAVDAGRARHRARLGSDRGLRRLSARARAGDALPHARQPDRRLRHPPCRVRNRVVAHQQDADRSRPRLRRPAGLLSRSSG